MATIEDTRAAVTRLAARVQAKNPGKSFLVRVQHETGQEPPGGFWAALRGNGFGQNDYMHVIERPSGGEAASQETSQEVSQAS